MSTTEALPTCRCDHGWVQVTEHYVDRTAPWPEPPPLGSPPDVQAAYDAEVARVAGRRAAIANTHYPCKVHNARLFYRWVRGCLAVDHDAAGCPECIEAGAVGATRAHRGRRRKGWEERPNEDAGPVAPPEDDRGDL